MAKTTKVSVPKGTGDIVISPGAGEALQFTEADGSVDVPDQHVDLFLTHVSRSTVARAATPPAKENK